MFRGQLHRAFWGRADSAELVVMVAGGGGC
jgi:hypothetical protein